MIARNGKSRDPWSWNPAGFKAEVPANRGAWDAVPEKAFHQRNYDSQYGGLGVREILFDLSGDRRVTRPYLQDPWVYASVAARARAIGAYCLQFTKEGSRGDQPLTKADPLVKLFRRPNPLMSQRMFLRQLENYQCLWGETYLLCMDNNGKPINPELGQGLSTTMPLPGQIWPVPGHLVEIRERGAMGLPILYRVHFSGGKAYDWPASSIIPITDVNPHDPVRGVGPVTVALRSVAKNYLIDGFDDALLANGGRPAGFLSPETTLDERGVRQTRRAYKEANQGADNNQKVGVLPTGMKWVQTGLGPQEMEFDKLRVWTREVIMATLGTTKPILGITDDVNRANSKEAYRVFSEMTISPEADFLEDQLQHRAIERFAGYETTMVTMDDSKVDALREAVDDKISRTLKLYSEGHRSFEEAAMIAGLDISDYKLEGIDERWIPKNLVPVEIALEGPPDPPPHPGSGGEGEDEEEPDEGAEEEETSVEVPETRASDVRNLVIQSAEQAEKAWKRHDDFLVKHEGHFERKVAGVYRRYTQSIKRKLRDLAEKKGERSILGKYVPSETEIEIALGLNEERWWVELEEATKASYIFAIDQAAKEISTGAGGLVSAADPEMLEFLAQKKIALREGWLSTVAEGVKARLLVTLAAIETTPQSLGAAVADSLADLIADVDKESVQALTRAKMIARTEVNSAVSHTRLQQMKRDGVKRHEWLASMDAATRHTHAELDGLVRAVGETFGNSLKYPGDPSAPAGEVINCRCTTLPVLED